MIRRPPISTLFPTRRSSDLSSDRRRDRRGHHSPHDGDRAAAADRISDPASRNQLGAISSAARSEEHTSELQSPYDLVCRLLLEKKKEKPNNIVKQNNEQKTT